MTSKWYHSNAVFSCLAPWQICFDTSALCNLWSACPPKFASDWRCTRIRWPARMDLGTKADDILDLSVELVCERSLDEGLLDHDD